MTQKAINYAEVLCELNIDAAELSDMEAVVRENPELQEALTCPVVSREKKSEVIVDHNELCQDLVQVKMRFSSS